MSKSEHKSKNPFVARVSCSKQSNFDKYYIDRQIITVFKATGQKDDDGCELGVAEQKVIDKKIDVDEFIESQRDSVGVEAYIRALTNQGENIDDYNTVVDPENINDFSEMPDSLAEVMLAGDRAKAAFANMDPALKGGHTTIEGFLNSLSQDSIDAYIKGRIEALTPKKEGD